jgi:carboxyl-terminal processing protease
MTRFASVLAALLVLAGSPAVAGRIEPSAPVTAPSTDRARMNLRVFDWVWNEVRRDYYDPRLHGVDWEAARRQWRPVAQAARDDRELYRALNAMLDLLDDDHAAVLGPVSVRRNEGLRQRRAVIGVTLGREDGDIYRVERVRPGSPAAEAGVISGWRLHTVDGRDSGTDFEVVEGRPLTLSLIDDAGVPREAVVTPRTMEPVPAFSVDRSREGVLVLRVEGFEPGLGRWLGDQLEGLPPETDVILDLRANPGGRLREANAVLACFLPRQQPWATRTARSGRTVVLKVVEPCGDLTAPVENDLAVLVDGASRSAAELTPAALQEAGRALVVGERTAGAVLISQDTPLPDGGRLTLSRADLITSGGVRLEKRGVEPDLAAVSTHQDRRAGADPALEAAIAALAADL